MAYNLRVYYYADDMQIRIYKKMVSRTFKQNEKEEEDLEDQVIYEQLTLFGEGKTKKNILLSDDKPPDLERSLRVSVNRTKNKIYDLARANRWEYFITLTFDQNRTDSSNYDTLLKITRKWFNNIKQRKAPDLKYLLIPELHKDGIHYHFHGLLANCEGIRFTDSGIRDDDNRIIYNMPDFHLGFTTATPVGETRKVSAYVCKYITKQLEMGIKNKRRYIASRNCEKPQIVKMITSSDVVEDMLYSVQDNITHMKQVEVPAAYQRIQYVDVRYDSPADS